MSSVTIIVSQELKSAIACLQERLKALNNPALETVDPIINLIHQQHVGCLSENMSALLDEHTTLYEEMIDPVGDAQENLSDLMTCASVVKTELAFIADNIGKSYQTLLFEYWDPKQKALHFIKLT